MPLSNLYLIAQKNTHTMMLLQIAKHKSYYCIAPILVGF
jgi:hypothetical protein